MNGSSLPWWQNCVEDVPVSYAPDRLGVIELCAFQLGFEGLGLTVLGRDRRVEPHKRRGTTAHRFRAGCSLLALAPAPKKAALRLHLAAFNPQKLSIMASEVEQRMRQIEDGVNAQPRLCRATCTIAHCFSLYVASKRPKMR